MREGLTFTYKQVSEIVSHKANGETKRVDYSYNTIYQEKLDSVTIFTYYRDQVYGCPVYLGGYFQQNDTLYLVYQDMNEEPKKCVSGYKYVYKINNSKFSYKEVRILEFEKIK